MCEILVAWARLQAVGAAASLIFLAFAAYVVVCVALYEDRCRNRFWYGCLEALACLLGLCLVISPEARAGWLGVEAALLAVCFGTVRAMDSVGQGLTSPEYVRLWQTYVAGMPADGR